MVLSIQVLLHTPSLNLLVGETILDTIVALLNYNICWIKEDCYRKIKCTQILQRTSQVTHVNSRLYHSFSYQIKVRNSTCMLPTQKACLSKVYLDNTITKSNQYRAHCLKTFENSQENFQLNIWVWDWNILTLMYVLAENILSSPFSNSDIWVENFLENTQKFYDGRAWRHVILLNNTFWPFDPVFQFINI
jgi:hypothetical protein